VKTIESFLDRVICGDCLEVMKGIPDGSVNLVLTDPPFNCGKDFDNDNLGEIEYFKWLDRIYGMIYLKMKNNTPFVTECSKRYLPQTLSLLNNYFNYEHQIIIYYNNQCRRGKIGWNNYSISLWCSKGKSKLQYHYMDVFSTPFEKEIKNINHKSPKFIKPYKKLVDLFSKENDIILDPFLGSGTTAVACKQLNRHYIGIEISPEYCKIAEERLRNTDPLFHQEHIKEKGLFK